MTRVFVLTNHKEGVGKSTSATNIAYGLVGLLRLSGAAIGISIGPTFGLFFHSWQKL